MRISDWSSDVCSSDLGTRGVGKTTIERIFAKSLNCERGTGADPCGECETCLAIDAGRYIDLLEIDAASNTGVDKVRDLIENAQYMPSRGRFEVDLGEREPRPGSE